MEKKNFKLPIEKIIKVKGMNIIDYSDSDFRDFWNDNSKQILNQYENNLLKKWQKHFPDDGWFIDIGCGFGRNLHTYFQKTRKIILVDFAFNHLEMAQKNYREFDNIYYIAADACNLPFKKSVFKAGISIRLLHHIEIPSKLLSEINRVMKENSKCIITYINKRSFFRILKYGKKSFIRDHSQLSTMIYGTHPQYFKTLTSESGFRIIKVKGSGFIHQLTGAFKPIRKIVNKRKIANFYFITIERIFGSIFGFLSLSLVQFTLLKTTAHKKDNYQHMENEDLLDILACPECKNGDLKEDTNTILCPQCGNEYPIKNSIIDFTIKNEQRNMP